MTMRWLLFDYVDRELPLTPAQRNQVRIRWIAVSGSMRGPHISWGVVLLSALMPGLGMLLAFAVFFLFFSTTLSGIAVMFAVQIAATWLLLALVGKRYWRPLVYAELRHLGYDVCTRYGYWLRDLPADVTRCPECGEQREAIDGTA